MGVWGRSPRFFLTGLRGVVSTWYFSRVLEAGHVIAQLNLGVCYTSGTGVEVDKQKAFKWFELAAKAGNIEAQCNLGICSANGGLGSL